METANIELTQEQIDEILVYELKVIIKDLLNPSLTKIDEDLYERVHSALILLRYCLSESDFVDFFKTILDEYEHVMDDGEGVDCA